MPSRSYPRSWRPRAFSRVRDMNGRLKRINRDPSDEKGGTRPQENEIVSCYPWLRRPVANARPSSLLLRRLKSQEPQLAARHPRRKGAPPEALK